MALRVQDFSRRSMSHSFLRNIPTDPSGFFWKSEEKEPGESAVPFHVLPSHDGLPRKNYETIHTTFPMCLCLGRFGDGAGRFTGSSR